ncbi:CD1375 family protein [Paenibacillus sp. FSL H7-0756]|nr:CD1375 family protein [Paenibacillus sp. FSL R7-277]
MAKIYANLINKGIKMLVQVPESIRADVAALLERENK